MGSVRDEIDALMREANEEDEHPYGPWFGGPKSAGGHMAKKGRKEAIERVGRQYGRGGTRTETPENTSDASRKAFRQSMRRRFNDLQRDEKDPQPWRGKPGTFIETRSTYPGKKELWFVGDDGMPVGHIIWAERRPPRPSVIGGPDYLRTGAPYIQSVAIFPGYQGQGLGAKMYDTLQDKTRYNVYEAIGQSRTFTGPGKRFAEAWLRGRLEKERQPRFAEAKSEKWTAQRALDHVLKAKVSKDGMPSPEEGAADLREAEDDHYYGPWSGGSKASGGRPATGGGGQSESDRRFEAGQRRMAKTVGGWKESRPWEASKEDIKAGRVPGVQYSATLSQGHGANRGGGNVAGLASGENITVGDAFFRMSPDARRYLLYHEAGHFATRGLQPKDIGARLERDSAGNYRFRGSFHANSDGYVSPGKMGEVMADAWATVAIYGRGGLYDSQQAFGDMVMNHGRQWGFPTDKVEGLRESVRGDIDVLLESAGACAFSEASGDDHFYGSWTGGSKSSGGRPAGGGSSERLTKATKELEAAKAAVKKRPKSRAAQARLERARRDASIASWSADPRPQPKRNTKEQALAQARTIPKPTLADARARISGADSVTWLERPKPTYTPAMEGIQQGRVKATRKGYQDQTHRVTRDRSGRVTVGTPWNESSMLWRPVREASSDDHFYGAWTGGSKAQGGRPGGGGGAPGSSSDDPITNRMAELGALMTDLPKEHAICMDGEGKIVFRADGDEDSVAMMPWHIPAMRGNHVMHNHPEGAGVWPSKADISTLVDAEIASMGVVGRDYGQPGHPKTLVRLHRPEGGWKAEGSTIASDMQHRANDNLSAMMDGTLRVRGGDAWEVLGRDGAGNSLIAAMTDFAYSKALREVAKEHGARLEEVHLP